MIGPGPFVAVQPIISCSLPLPSGFSVSSRRPALAAAALALVGALAANAVVQLRAVDALAEGAANEARPAEVQRTLLGVLAAVQEAESGKRGYLLTGDVRYLAAVDTAPARADSLLARLDTLVSWNPLQVSRMPRLRAAVVENIAVLDGAVRRYDLDGPDAALAAVRSDQSAETTADVRRRVEAMLAEARRVHAAYGARARAAERRARVSALVATGALAALLAALGAGVVAAGRRRDRDAAALAEQAGALAERRAELEASNARLSTALAEREAALGRVRAMQAQLVQQEKLAGMGRLTAGVAHEIQNPLNFVLNFAGLTVDLAGELDDALRRGDAAEAGEAAGAVRQNAAAIAHHAGRADRIVRSMLVHARGVTGERRPADVGQAVRAAVAQATGPDAAGDVEVTVEVDPALGPAEVVAESVTRAVRNLVENALHAARERAGAGDPTYAPRVDVSVALGADHDGHAAAVVRVADNGAGIPDDLFPRIFEPFFTTKGPGVGTGLGLSLAHDIAVGHGGSLLAERPAGGGAAFVLTLPLVPPAGGGDDDEGGGGRGDKRAPEARVA